MDPVQRADNLEFWAGRDRFSDAGEDPDRRSRPPRRPAVAAPRPGLPRGAARIAADHSRRVLAGVATFVSRRGARGRARPLAAAALLAALTAGWLAVGRGPNGPAALDAGAAAAGFAAQQTASTTAPSTTGPSTTGETAATLPFVKGCSGLSAQRPAVRCTDGGIEIEARRYADATAVATAYTRATGRRPVPAAGPPACAAGEAEERSWSAPAAPGVVAGRYRCAFERGRAAMWWTHGARLFHAVAADDDLGRLFDWWRARPSE